MRGSRRDSRSRATARWSRGRVPARRASSTGCRPYRTSMVSVYKAGWWLVVSARKGLTGSAGWADVQVLRLRSE